MRGSIPSHDEGGRREEPPYQSSESSPPPSPLHSAVPFVWAWYVKNAATRYPLPPSAASICRLSTQSHGPSVNMPPLAGRPHLIHMAQRQAGQAPYSPHTSVTEACGPCEWLKKEREDVGYLSVVLNVRLPHGFLRPHRFLRGFCDLRRRTSCCRRS